MQCIFYSLNQTKWVRKLTPVCNSTDSLTPQNSTKLAPTQISHLRTHTFDLQKMIVLAQIGCACAHLLCYFNGQQYKIYYFLFLMADIICFEFYFVFILSLACHVNIIDVTHLNLSACRCASRHNQHRSILTLHLHNTKANQIP